MSVTLRERSGSYGGGSEVLVLESNQNHATIKDTEICTTLPASMGMGGGYVPMISCVGGGETAQTLDASYYKGPGARNGKEREIVAVEPSYMSDRKGHNGVTTDGTATTLTAQEKERPLVGTSVVRRLTPLECTRLQGFPDGWVDIGDWTDSNGRVHKDADTPKYKALGNSIAIPFWQWLARRICAEYERTVTMGSLFDGIGGFPLCFERCGGKAVWASEIEDFPIAVTKHHFPEDE